MSEYQAGTRPPAVQLATTDVQPPSALYISEGEQLFIRSWNAISSAAFTVDVRMLLPTGEIKPFSYTITPTSDRIVQQTVVDLAEGWLLSVSAYAGAVVVRSGGLFLNVLLVRGGLATFHTGTVLIADYLTHHRVISWPVGRQRQFAEAPGRIRLVVGTNPGAGAQISETVPTNARWRLHGLVATLVTSATAATRQVQLYVYDGINTVWERFATATQTASLSRNYVFSADGAGSAANDIDINEPLPINLVLEDGWIIETFIRNGQAGDDWGAPQMLVEEWIEP